MTFYEYYRQIEGVAQKRAFRKQIVLATEIEPGTFYTWLQRKTVPKVAQSIISKIMNKAKEELFPKVKIEEMNFNS